MSVQVRERAGVIAAEGPQVDLPKDGIRKRVSRSQEVLESTDRPVEGGSRRLVVPVDPLEKATRARDEDGHVGRFVSWLERQVEELHAGVTLEPWHDRERRLPDGSGAAHVDDVRNREIRILRQDPIRDNRPH